MALGFRGRLAPRDGQGLINKQTPSPPVSERSGTDVDYARLAEFLTALAYPARLELLRILRFPHLAGDIKLTPRRVEPGENPDRTASKQTIQAHLDKLVDADLVRSEPAKEGTRKAHVYTVNSQKVYAVTEELRKVSTIFAGRGAVGDLTGTMIQPPIKDAAAPGPRLVLVHGLYEGQAFALDERVAAEGAWIIGRARGLAISLDYDPYVSLENSALRRQGDRFTIEDLATSKNGTTVNWKPVPKGERRTLRPSDVIGVGRSLFVFSRD